MSTNEQINHRYAAHAWTKGVKKSSDLNAGAKPPALDTKDKMQVANQI